MEQGDSSAGVLDGVETKLLCPGTVRTSVAGVENLREKRQRTGCVLWAIVGTVAFTLLALEATRGLGR